MFALIGTKGITDKTSQQFKLSQDFLKTFEGKRPNFGYNGLGELVYYRTYSRLKENGEKETPLDTFTRVVEGCYEIQRRHCRQSHIPWSHKKAQKSAQEMFTRMWEFKFLPPGRGLWAMGTDFMWERGSAALNNCSFVSTIDITDSLADPFCFTLDMSMLGVGVGFDTLGAGKVSISPPTSEHNTFTVPDSREGWVESLKLLLDSYQNGSQTVVYDYSLIRPAGSKISGFGGKASGHTILEEMIEDIRSLLHRICDRSCKTLNSVDIVDIMNIIGKCVVAGNVRRTALLALGHTDDKEYRNAKNYLLNLTDEESAAFLSVTAKLYSENRMVANEEDFKHLDINADKLRYSIDTWNSCNHHRWASNNSVYVELGEDYTEMAKCTATNGEPGYIWLDNIQNFGRMADGRGFITDKATGVNPCSEQALESYELCTLCETFPEKHEDTEDYYRTLKFAYLYAKTVTLLPTHNKRTNAVMLKNRRIGLSQSGIVQAFRKFGRRRVLTEFCDAGYKIIRKWDAIYSDWLCCPKSIKVTTVKPSGSVSLVVGATAGIHYSIAPTRNYWRRVRIAANSSLVKALTAAGYHVEPLMTDKERTMVVKFGISEPDVETINEISIWEQVKNSVDYQRFWSDNNVSVTVQFTKREANQIADVLEAYEDDLKTISFLPLEDHGYSQAPYEAATEEEIIEYNKNIKPVDFSEYIYEDAICEKFCDGDKCQVS